MEILVEDSDMSVINVVACTTWIWKEAACSLGYFNNICLAGMKMMNLIQDRRFPS
jgi:hypothetical protein